MKQGVKLATMHNRPMAGRPTIVPAVPALAGSAQRDAMGKVGAQCCVPFLTTTRAHCIAGLQTRRRLLFVSPSSSLLGSSTADKPFVVRVPCFPAFLPRCALTRLPLLLNSSLCSRIHYESTIAEPRQQPLLLSILPAISPSESTSAVGSPPSDTACSKPCTSLLASIPNPSLSGRTHLTGPLVEREKIDGGEGIGGVDSAGGEDEDPEPCVGKRRQARCRPKVGEVL